MSTCDDQFDCLLLVFEFHKRQRKHRLFKLDIKEYSRKKRDQEGVWKGFGVKIGDGDCDWPQVRAALKEVGFTGWATAEVGGGGEERLTDIARRMDRVLALKSGG